MLRLVPAIDQVLQGLERLGNVTHEVLLIQPPSWREVSYAHSGSTGAALLSLGGWLSVVLKAHTNGLGNTVCLNRSLAKLQMHLPPKASIE
jgi:hypothetical protein